MALFRCSTSGGGGGSGNITELIPTMTSNTTPSGKCTLRAQGSADHTAYYAFDNNKDTYFGGSASGSGSSRYNWVAYTFDAPVKATMAVVIPHNSTTTSSIYVDGSNNHVDYQTVGDFDILSETKTCTSGKVYYFKLNPTQAYKTYRVYMVSNSGSIGCYYFQIFGEE